MKSNNELENILDKATTAIREEEIEPAVVKAAAERVWARLAAENIATDSATVAAERIESCADFQSLIPDYLKNNLSEARKLLLVDHTHECIPCRRALKEARSRAATLPRPTAQKAKKSFNIQPVVLRWGVAAVLVLGFGLLAFPVLQNYLPFGGEFEATVQAAEGQVYQILDTQSISLGTGQQLQRGEKIRTAKDAYALVRLGDGSTIEMKDRSELSITNNAQGTTIHLNRGSIVVEAAKQRGTRLFVDTGDSLVTVTGTIFSVNNGTKGSRVSVIEGEVRLDHGGANHIVRGGEQVTTNKAIKTIPVKEEVAWSRKSATYAETLAALTALNTELSKVGKPELRSSTRLLDLMPADTVFYAALPNLTSTIAESHRIMQERVQQNAALREWWAKEHAGRGPKMDQVIGTVREFGDYLGDEIAVSLSMDQKGEPTAPLVLAQLKDSAGFREFVERQIAQYQTEGKGPAIKFVADPASVTAVTPEDKRNEELYVWINSDLFAASPRLQQLQQVAELVRHGGTSEFTASQFHNRIAHVYAEGAGLVVAANLERVIEQTKTLRAQGEDAQKHENALERLGILSVKYFVLDQKDTAGKTNTRAVLSFNQSQRGIPSWLAAPGPMGSLEYVSPDANVVAGFVVKDPVSLVDDLIGAIETVSPDLRKNLDQLQAERGLDLRRDFAAPLGGEFAFAIDGPILPTPSWKLVFEVNSPEHLQGTLERVIVEINKEAAKHGKAGLIWDQAEIGGRTYYTLKSADFGLLEVNFTYINGYLVMGPSRGLVERAIRSSEAGHSLLRSSRFVAGLPADGNANFSAVFYHNLAPLVQPFADRIANSNTSIAQEHQQAIKAMAGDMAPTLAYAYAHGDSITFAANTEGGPFGLSPATLLGMPNSLEIQHILQQGMKGN